jgi:hypothetical protein
LDGADGGPDFFLTHHQVAVYNDIHAEGRP